MQVETSLEFLKPRARVLARFRDLERIEGALRANGLGVERRADWPEAAWQCSVNWHESPRVFDLNLSETEPGSAMQMRIASMMITGTVGLVFADRPDGCHLAALADLTPRTLPARLALQAVSLARGKVEARLARFLGVIARG